MRRVIPTKRPANPLVSTASDLGGFVRFARTTEGLSLDDAAKSIGIAKQTLHDIEMGKETVALGIVLRVLADLGVNMFLADSRHADNVADAIAASIEAHEGIK